MPVGLPADELLHRNLYYLYGIERREVRRDNFADLWQAIEESIAADRVLLAWVDAHEVSDAAFYYNRIPGASEAMLIYGYDQAADALMVLVNPQGFVGQMPLSCLPEMLSELVVYDYAVPEGLDPYPIKKMGQVLLRDVREMLAGNKVGQRRACRPRSALSRRWSVRLSRAKRACALGCKRCSARWPYSARSAGGWATTCGGWRLQRVWVPCRPRLIPLGI